VRSTIEELELKLFEQMGCVRNWNPDTQTVLDLKQAYKKALKLAEKLCDNKALEELTEFSRFYSRPFDHHDPENICDGKEIAVLLDDDNQIFAVDSKGYCLLLYDIDKCGYSVGDIEHDLYVIRSAGDVYSTLQEKSYRDHMMSKDD
jgi:hypothetical protein